MEHDRLIMTPEEVLKRCDENTIGVVPTLGVTFTCQFEPVRAVAEALDRLETERGLDIPIHVDGASGGFLGAVLRARRRLGFPDPTREVDQQLGPQVRARAAWSRVGSSGATPTTSRKTWCSG